MIAEEVKIWNMLSIVFVFKIALTVVVWCVPLLLFPSWLEGHGMPQQPTYMFFRLLGMAYLALVVGYVFGLRQSFQGKRLLSSILVGIVSNGGACLILLLYGQSGAWATWGNLMQWVMWGSMVATGLITVGLIVFGLLDKTLPMVE